MLILLIFAVFARGCVSFVGFSFLIHIGLFWLMKSAVIEPV